MANNKVDTISGASPYATKPVSKATINKLNSITPKDTMDYLLGNTSSQANDIPDFMRAKSNGSSAQKSGGTQFNPNTQKWEGLTIPKFNTSSTTKSTTKSSAPKATNPASTQPVTTQKSDGKGTRANKDYVDKVTNYLEGTAKVEPNSVTLSMIAGDTVNLSNLGQFLTGTYLLKNVEITIDASSGLSLEYELMRNGVGSTLKPAPAVVQSVPETQQEATPQSAQADNTPPVVTSNETASATALTSGDRVTFIQGVDAIYSNASEGKKVPDWVKKNTHTVSKLSSDKERALLKEINSWTYVKFLQKA